MKLSTLSLLLAAVVFFADPSLSAPTPSTVTLYRRGNNNTLNAVNGGPKVLGGRAGGNQGRSAEGNQGRRQEKVQPEDGGAEEEAGEQDGGDAGAGAGEGDENNNGEENNGAEQGQDEGNNDGNANDSNRNDRNGANRNGNQGRNGGGGGRQRGQVGRVGGGRNQNDDSNEGGANVDAAQMERLMDELQRETEALVENVNDLLNFRDQASSLTRDNLLTITRDTAAALNDAANTRNALLDLDRAARDAA